MKQIVTIALLIAGFMLPDIAVAKTAAQQHTALARTNPAPQYHSAHNPDNPAPHNPAQQNLTGISVSKGAALARADTSNPWRVY